MNQAEKELKAKLEAGLVQAKKEFKSLSKKELITLLFYANLRAEGLHRKVQEYEKTRQT